MKVDRNIAIASIQDNKLFMVRMVDSEIWTLPQVRQGNWLSEERAINGRIQKEIGCPVGLLGRIGDFEIEVKKGHIRHLSVFLCSLRGVIFIRNKSIAEWRYIAGHEWQDIVTDQIIYNQIVPCLITKRLLTWPHKK